MFGNSSLRSQFKMLVAPIMVMSSILILFITFNEYKNIVKLENLEKDINVVEDLRKLITLITKEREISINILLNSNAMGRRLERALVRERSLNSTRVKSLKQKLESYDVAELKTKPFLFKVSNIVGDLEEELSSIRKKLDNREITPAETVSFYTNLISTFIDTIATASVDIEDSYISKNIVLYSLFLNYYDISTQREILVSRVISQKEIDDDIFTSIVKLDAERVVVTSLIKSLVSEELFNHYDRLSHTNEFENIESVTNAILNKDIEKIELITYRDFMSVSAKYNKTLKELGDYISSNISEEMSHMIDEQEERESLLTLVFFVGSLIILLSTYSVYNYLRETLFFGTIQIRSKILRVVSDISYEKNESKNEITSLISLVSLFVKVIKETLEKIRANFRDIVNLSNHLSESSEVIVNHLQKQSQYLQDINLQMALFLENIQNSEISFENLKEIIEDSSAKINNLNLDVVYISYEVLSLKDLNRKISDNHVILKEMVLQNISALQSGDEVQISETMNSFQKMVEIIDQQKDIMHEKEIKLSNLSKTALTIKKDAELNNANLSDILGVITVLGYETKMITHDINTTVEDNNKFIEKSKIMVQKSEFVSSDVKMLNRYIISLDKEFNRFRF
jgi:hypothetical protein